MPAKLSAILRVLKEYDATIEPPSSGSHYKAFRNGVLYTIPAHNGLKSEISDIYIKQLCKMLGINYDEFVKSL
jgi:hypothetical protein